MLFLTTKRARRKPGPSAVELQFGLQAKLIVEANAGNEELVVVVVVAAEEGVAADRSTGVRHADDAVAEAEVVVVVLVHADPQPFELDRQVVGPSVLDTAAEHPAGVVVV